jgi:hypothetical protein
LLHILDGIGRLDVQRDGLTGQCLHENLHYVFDVVIL